MRQSRSAPADQSAGCQAKRAKARCRVGRAPVTGFNRFRLAAAGLNPPAGSSLLRQCVSTHFRASSGFQPTAAAAHGGHPRESTGLTVAFQRASGPGGLKPTASAKVRSSVLKRAGRCSGSAFQRTSALAVGFNPLRPTTDTATHSDPLRTPPYALPARSKFNPNNRAKISSSLSAAGQP
jgi:hypothetical protein